MPNNTTQIAARPCHTFALAVALALLTIPLAAPIPAQEARMANDALSRYASVQSLKAQTDLQEGALAETAGFHAAGDGGEALYRIEQLSADSEPNGADIIALDNGLAAVLLESKAVNYRMFGAVGDGENDDGAQIKLAHEYAIERRIPIVNLTGEFWFKQTNAIPIKTNVSWGNTVFHIDERYNSRRAPRFVVENDEPTETLELDEEQKATLLEKIRPGVQVIPELAEYAGHLISVQDTEDRIGIRAGYEGNRGWAREELFYVEEEGRIIGDIAWQFTNFTSVKAIPCNDVYTVIEGGGFWVSGDTPESGEEGYHQNGFSIRRSRTVVREQWVGLEPGKSDESLEPRSGFYSFSNVYDVTLENVRLMPWIYSRTPKEKSVKHGTYGIGGARMLNCTFRNLTAEAGWASWGVFGTNLNKNFRIENCRLNRVDVHFHCWNLTIKDSEIGFKGITVTGGGDLTIENTTRHGNNFIGFRSDYGSKWDGRIRLSGCTLKPTSNGGVSVLGYAMRDFDYQYPIGYARSIVIEDLTLDYSAAPASEAPCWLMSTRAFSQTQTGARLFFPTNIVFRDIRAIGREQGVRLIRVPSPHYYDLGRAGGFDGTRLQPNCTIDVENVQLEALTPERPGDTGNVHLQIGGEEEAGYTDERSLYPSIRFRDCDGVSAYIGNCIADASFDRCSINALGAPNLEGALSFVDCRFQPQLAEVSGDIYVVDGALGTRFTNCTIHAPIVAGEPRPDLVDSTGLVRINESVEHYHINTTLGNGVLEHLKQAGTVLDPGFIAKLKLHHALEE